MRDKSSAVEETVYLLPQKGEFCNKKFTTAIKKSDLSCHFVFKIF